MDNKQQTALQTLIDGLIVRKENIIKNADSMSNDMLEGGVMAFESAIDLAQSLLVMDKEQAIKFALCYAFGQYNVSKDLKTHIEKFYEQTYGGNK
jgi:hypothetical protein